VFHPWSIRGYSLTQICKRRCTQRNRRSVVQINAARPAAAKSSLTADVANTRGWAGSPRPRLSARIGNIRGSSFPWSFSFPREFGEVTFADRRTTPAVDSHSAPGMVAPVGRGFVLRCFRAAVRHTVLAKRSLSLRSQEPGRQRQNSPGRPGLAERTAWRCSHAGLRRSDRSFSRPDFD
jgi:hypothetical protein